MYDYLTQFLQTADEICAAVQDVCIRAVREVRSGGAAPRPPAARAGVNGPRGPAHRAPLDLRFPQRQRWCQRRR